MEGLINPDICFGALCRLNAALSDDKMVIRSYLFTKASNAHPKKHLGI